MLGTSRKIREVLFMWNMRINIHHKSAKKDMHQLHIAFCTEKAERKRSSKWILQDSARIFLIYAKTEWTENGLRKSKYYRVCLQILCYFRVKSFKIASKTGELTTKTRDMGRELVIITNLQREKLEIRCDLYKLALMNEFGGNTPLTNVRCRSIILVLFLIKQ